MPVEEPDMDIADIKKEEVEREQDEAKENAAMGFASGGGGPAPA